MKRILCLFLNVFIMLFCFIVEANALTIQLIPSKVKVAPNEEFKLQLLFTNYDSNYTSGKVEINYDTNLFEYISYIYSGENPNITVNSNNNVINLNYSYEGYPENKIVHIKFRAKSNASEGQRGDFSLKIKSGDYESTINKEISIKLPSSNANLSSLSLNNGTLSPIFDPNVLNYTASVDSATIKISATKSDSAAKITGVGTKSLNYGLNNFEIKVTAENGLIKIYKLAITRIDSRNSDSTLKDISLSDGSIDFSSSKKDYNVNVSSSLVTVNATKSNSNAKIEYPNGNTVNLNYGETKIVRIKVTAENGSTSLYSVSLTRKDTRSDDSSLKDITLSNGTLDFNSSKKNYEVNVSASRITINAIKNNSNAKLEYLTGNTIYLDYGESKTIKIRVTSEKGTSSIYSITLTRRDTRSNDATLKSLTVTNTDIKFNRNTTYNAQVENNVNKIEIKASSTNNNATIYGLGVKDLSVGNNSFIITVKAENGETKNYVVVINRKAKTTENNKNESNKLSSDNKLKSITIDEINFEFDKDILDYNLFVDYNVDKININYIPSSDKSSVTMTDISYLEIGLNIVDLIVVAENGSVKTYTLNITRRPERLVAENNSYDILELINSDSYDDIYVIDESNRAPYTISSDVLSALKETGKTLIYEITDDLGIVYQIKFVGGELSSTNEMRFAVWFGSPNSFEINSIVGSQEYLSFRFAIKGDAPDGVHLSIYEFTQINDKENLDLYEYDEDNNKLNLILDDVIIKDNVIELDINDLTKEYVIAEISPIEYTGEIIGESTTINLPLIFVVVIFFAAVITLVIIKIKKKKHIKNISNINGISNINNIDSNNK